MFSEPLGASLTLLLAAFLVTFGISTFVDDLHWPSEEYKSAKPYNCQYLDRPTQVGLRCM